MDSNSPTFWDADKAVAMAGFIGSVLSLSFIDDMGRRQRLVAVISGIVMAHYLSPLIASLFHEENYQETIGFLVGLFGMSICASVFRAIKNSDLWLLLRKRFSNGQDGDA